MANHLDRRVADGGLEDVFIALADPTRRQVVRHLGRGPASVGELARPFPITLPSFMKHLRMLETSGLIRTTKSGRVRTCTLNRDRLALLDDWLAEQRSIWEARTDRTRTAPATGRSCGTATPPREPATKSSASSTAGDQ